MFRRAHRIVVCSSALSGVSSLAWCSVSCRQSVRYCATGNTTATGATAAGAAKATTESAGNASSGASSSSDVAVHQESSIEKKTGSFLEPSDDVVLEYARHALKREGRDQIPESIIWKWETTHAPILAQGKQNYFEYTDDIPAHVKPFWHHEYYQQREYFKLQREKKPFLQRLKSWSPLFLALAVVGAALACFRIWVDQPKQIRQLREEILQQTYGRVLELAAGHGQNIGAYPYAVHEIVMCDSSPQQLQSLRYRIPKTAYPKYEIRRMRSEKLDGFKDGEFDCVVDMFGLCHLQDPVMALRQMQRVIKPTGMILLLEHGQSSYPWVNWFLDYFEQRHNVNTHGCKWNMPVREYLREARLEVRELRNIHYGTTYYVVAYPEQVEAYKERVARTTGAVATA